MVYEIYGLVHLLEYSPRDFFVIDGYLIKVIYVCTYTHPTGR